MLLLWDILARAVVLLHGHIDKEDNNLYPLAEQVRPRMCAAYQAAEAKAPQLEACYRELVESYERQAAA